MKFLNLNRFCSLLLAVASCAIAQTSNVKVTPDCLFTGSVSGSGSSSVTAGGNGDNRSLGCNFWVVVWEVTGGGSPTVTVQSATTASGVPVSWGTFAGTVTTGANPSTDAVGTTVLTGYVPWIRTTLASGGTMTVRMFGYRYPGSSAGGGGGGGGGSVTVTNIGYGLPACSLSPSRAVVSIAGTGSTIVIPPSGSTVIKLCKVQILGNAATTLQFFQGTGVGCATGTGPLTGAMPNVTGVVFDYDGGMILAAGQAFCVSSSVAAALGGVVTYVQN